MEKEKKGTLMLKILDIMSLISCMICILGGGAIGIAGIVMCGSARDDRDAALAFCSSISLVVRLEDDLIDETISVGTIADEPPQTLRTYQFADGEVITVPDSDVRRDIQYEKSGEKFISTLKGTDIKRRRSINADGVQGMQYKLNSIAVYALPNGRTVRYDQIAWVEDAETNDRISADYREIKMGGAIIFMALLLSFFDTIFLIVIFAAKKIIKNVYQLGSVSTDEEATQYNIHLNFYDDEGGVYRTDPIIERVTNNEYKVQATIPIRITGDQGEVQIVESQFEAQILIT